jgi:hypothetical protein
MTVLVGHDFIQTDWAHDPNRPPGRRKPSLRPRPRGRSGTWVRTMALIQIPNQAPPYMHHYRPLARLRPARPCILADYESRCGG